MIAKYFHTNKFIVLGIFVILFFTNFFLAAQADQISFQTYGIDQIPSPKEKGQNHFVANPDGIIDNYTVQLLDSISQNIDDKTSAEFAIVVVDDYEGDSDFEFALALFNKWGIGKKASNNGLLLFIAKDRREYRFISGYGMESIFPDAYLKRVGELYLVPNFKQGDYKTGLLQASRFIEQILLSPDSVAELERMMPEAIPFFSWRNPILKNSLLVLCLIILVYVYLHIVIKKLLDGRKAKDAGKPILYGVGCVVILFFFSIFPLAFIYEDLSILYNRSNIPLLIFIVGGIIVAMKINSGHKVLTNASKDEEDRLNLLKKFMGFSLIPMFLAPLAIFDLVSIQRRVAKNRGRFNAPDESGDWYRMNRVTDAEPIRKAMDQGQKVEEKIKSRNYEVWKNKKTGKFEFIPWDIDRKIDQCPQCGFYTLHSKQVKTIQAATYSSEGKGEEFDKCDQCSYRKHNRFFDIPKRTRSSSGSGGSGSSSGGGGGSSSGGGSFGGGSSGGGGAGGRW